MLAQVVQILTIQDAEGFVHAEINKFQRPTRSRGRIDISEEMREELVSEGIAILYSLARSFKSRSVVHDGPSRFDGYAAQMLGRKLGDAWHRMHEEHFLRTQPNGKRIYEYGEAAISLEALTAEDPDRHTILAVEDPDDVEGRLRAALQERANELVERAVSVGMLLSQKCSFIDAGHVLGLTGQQVRDAVADIQYVAHALREEA